MRKFNMKAAALGVAVAMAAVTAVSVEPAAAFPKAFPPGGGGKFPGGGWGGKFGGWGHHGHWGWAGYGGGYYGGCYLKQYYDEDGDVVVSRVCY